MSPTPEHRYPQLDAALKEWASQDSESFIAKLLGAQYAADVCSTLPATQKDYTSRFLAAVYDGGFETGKALAQQTFPAWEVWEVKDERNTKGEFLGVFTTKALADDVARGKGGENGHGHVKEVRCIVIFGVVYKLEWLVFDRDINVDLPTAKKEKRAAALSKLTPEEIDLLGIKNV
jgi:hypothetical protein